MERYDEFPIVDLAEVGVRINSLRKANHLKVTDISDRMGFNSPQAVYKWQRGDCLPDVVNLLVLARMLKVSIEELLLGQEEAPLPFFTESRERKGF